MYKEGGKRAVYKEGEKKKEEEKVKRIPPDIELSPTNGGILTRGWSRALGSIKTLCSLVSVEGLLFRLFFFILCVQIVYSFCLECCCCCSWYLLFLLFVSFLFRRGRRNRGGECGPTSFQRKGKKGAVFREPTLLSG